MGAVEQLAIAQSGGRSLAHCDHRKTNVDILTATGMAAIKNQNGHIAANAILRQDHESLRELRRSVANVALEIWKKNQKFRRKMAARDVAAIVEYVAEWFVDPVCRSCNGIGCKSCHGTGQRPFKMANAEMVRDIVAVVERRFGGLIAQVRERCK